MSALAKSNYDIALNHATLTKGNALYYCPIQEADYFTMLSAAISTGIVTNIMNGFVGVIQSFVIQASNIVTQVFCSVFIILHRLKIIGINYGMWASLTTHWLWDFINTFIYFDKPSDSEAYATELGDLSK